MELTEMTKDELISTYIQEIGEEPLARATKADLIDAINAHRVSKAGDQAEFFDHELTQADLDANPDLAAAGLKVGDVIQVPVKPDADDQQAESDFYAQFGELADDEMIVVKFHEDGSLEDAMKMKTAAYELLPAHKFGWQPAPPREIA